MVGYKRDSKGTRGFWVEGELVCPDCIEDEELEEITAMDVLKERKEKQTEYFCSRCQRRL